MKECGDESGRPKRKRGGQTEAPAHMRSPCCKAARPGSHTVFLCGFTDREKRDLRRHSAKGIQVEEVVKTTVTHVVVKPPSKRDKSYPYSALYFAVVSGAWILRPSWILSSKSGIELETDHEFTVEDSDSSTAEFADVLSLYMKRRQSSAESHGKMFSNEIFRRVFVLSSRTQEGRQRKAIVQSLIKAGGGSTVVDECWRTVREKPGKASCVVSAIIIVNGEDIRSHNISLSFIKLLLKQCIPVLYEEMLSQILINQVIPDAEIMVTHAVYYWCNQHPEKLKFSEEDLEEIRILQQQLASASRKCRADDCKEDDAGQISSEGPTQCSEISDDYWAEVMKNGIVIVDDGASSCCVIDDPEDDCGLFETIDLDKESERQPTKVKWSDGMATLSYLVPQALARSGVPEYGRQFDSSAAVYRLLMFFLYQFPPCNAEARFFWLQVLTGASSSEDEPSESTGRRGSFLNGRSLLSRVNEFRRMILETFTEDVSVLLEKPQDSSVLDGVSLSYLIFYEPYERRKRGLDKSAMETCMSIIDMALSTNSTVKLFKREQISIDLQIDIERIGRYLMKRGMDIDEIRSNIRIDWICNVIAAMS
ncbi:unnamed protein product [Nippostrongylus brasiliensis]|uniref:BRCT domain-containing protein n=2 Tax=Nippostrongylus brasiliensis TaxID=27835 RepID=A0A0N4YB25_NIPBR|nr:unnamed protein product [Nippostrongylus brasiliensis]